MPNITHTATKGGADGKTVTGYEIKIDGATVGTAVKTEKGKFNFTAANGAGENHADVKTMRDLKVAVGKSVPATFVTANKPAPKPAKTKTPGADAVAKGEPTNAPNTQAPAAATDGDLDLD